MKRLFLLSLIVPIICQGKEVFTNEQGLKIEYVKPSLSCFYDKEAYEGYLNTCLILSLFGLMQRTKWQSLFESFSRSEWIPFVNLAVVNH